MSIRPVDMQVTLPHATDVGKVQAVQNEQSSAAQQLFAEKLMKEAQERQGQVQGTQSTEFAKVNREKEKEEEERKKKKNKGAKEQKNFSEQKKDADKAKEQRKHSLDPVLGKNLDISS